MHGAAPARRTANYAKLRRMLPLATKKDKTKWRAEWIEVMQREKASARDDRHFMQMVERRGSFGTTAK